jgi:hypothetical protein
MFGWHTGHHRSQAKRKRQKYEAALIGGEEKKAQFTTP